GPGPSGTCEPIASRHHARRQDRVPRRLIRTTIDDAAKRMKLVPYQMERWQSTWEHRVEFNLSESGVEPLPLRELLRDEAAIDRFLNHPLAYSQGNGTPELRSSIASLYPGTTPDHVLVTDGSSEACLLALWHLVEAGDEVVLLLPNDMESWGLIQMCGGKVRPLGLGDDLGCQFDPAELATRVNRRRKA